MSVQRIKIFTLKNLVYIGLFALMILIGYLVVVSGIVEDWAARGGGWWLALTFLAGLLFTSFSTIPLATAVFISLAHAGLPIWQTAFIGGLGAMIGDAGLFAALKVSVLDTAAAYLARKTHGAFQKFAHKPLVRLGSVLVGGLVIASPLPDELGMAIMGLTDVPTRYVFLIAFVFDTASIAAISYLAR
jgi:hypothetical protein